MYRRILAALNEHFNSEMAARYALRLAKSCSSKLYLCFVADGRLSPVEFGKAEAALKRLFLKAEQDGIRTESVVLTGDPVAETGQIVRKEKIDMAFVSTRREDIERRFYSGTVARRLMLNLPCSVALVRVVQHGRICPREILVPLKAKIDHLRRRALFISAMAQSCNARPVILHVPRPVTSLFHGEIHLTPAEWERHIPPDITGLIGIIRKSGIEVYERISPGQAGRRITIEAAARRHDLIIMGASRRSLISTLLKGNPVEDVLRETPCDLIIFRPANEHQ